jgi:GNAT superfamily N-acetyltransferase
VAAGEEGGVVVRTATARDAAPIANLHVRSWQAAYDGMMPQDYLDGLDPAGRLPLWRRVLGEPDPARRDVLVAAGETGICGFSSFGPTRDGDEDPDRVAEVRAIYLAPSALGQGYGRRLMAASLEHLTRLGYQQVTLWVLDVNMRARRFYELAGFQPDGGLKTDDREGISLREVRYRRPLP